MEKGQSEVARLLQQIALEYDAARQGLHGLASGTSRHEYITRRMENVQQAHVVLQGIIGPEQAIKLVAEALENS